MAGKAIQIIAGGIGVASTAPFGVGSYTIVSQTDPPIITAGRLAQLADAVQSIVARDVNAPADNTGLVLGVLSSTRGRPNSLVIGNTVLDSGDATAQRNILIGFNLDPGAAKANFNFNVIIGGQNDLTQTDGSVVAIGHSQTRSGAAFLNNAVYIGRSMNASGGDAVGIGQGCDVTGQSVAIGQGALATGSQGVVIGQGATNGGNINNVGVGRRARPGANAVAIGFFCDGLGDSSIAIGRDANDSSNADSILIGRGTASAGAGAIVLGRGAGAGANVCIIGGPSVFISEFKFGAGTFQDGAPATAFTFSTTETVGGGGAANSAGYTLIIRAGRGKGNWANAENRGLDLRVGLLGASGTTFQAETSVLAIRHSDLNASFWGGLAFNFQAGVRVLHIDGAGVTAPTGNPATGFFLFVDPADGILKARGTAGTITPLAIP